MQGFTPLKHHTDVAAFLGVRLFALHEYERALTVLTDVAENLEPGAWSRTYVGILDALNSKRIDRRVSTEARLHFYNAFGLCLSHSGEPRKAIIWFERLRLLARRLKSTWGLGQAYIHLGVVHHELGDDNAAARFYRRGIEHGRRVGDDLIVGRCLNNLAMITADSDLDSAERLVRKSQRYKARARDEQGDVFVFLGLGSVAVGRRDFRRAATHFSEAERRARRLDLRHARAIALVNLGSAHIDLVRAESKQTPLKASQTQAVKWAILRYQAALSIADTEGFEQIRVLATQGEAGAAALIGEYVLAASLFQALHRLKVSGGDTEGSISALHDAGVSAIKGGREPHGRVVVARALRLARRAASTEWVVRCHVTIAASYSRQVKTRRALRAAAHLESRLHRFDAARRLWESLVMFEVGLGQWDAVEVALSDATKSLGRYKAAQDEVLALHKLHFQLSREHHRVSQALDALAEMTKLAAARGDQLEFARATDEKGVLFQELREFKSAERAHRAALRISEVCGYEAQRAISLNNLGELLRNTGRAREAVRIFKETEQVLRSLRDRESELSTAHNRALAIEDLGRVSQAEDLLQQIKHESRQRGFLDQYVRALWGLANIAWTTGRKRLAIRRLEAGLRDARRFTLPQREVEIAASLAHFLRALRRSREAIPILRSVENSGGPDAQTVKRLLALSFEDLEDWSSAASSWKRLLTTAESIGDQSTVAESHAAIAHIHQRTNPEIADAEFAKALEAEQDPEGRALLLADRLRLLLRLNREGAAEKALNEVRALAKERGFEEILIDVTLAPR